MSKALLLSVRPKWCALEMNGIKKIEVRKGTALYKAIQKLIDEYGYAEFYVYNTRDERYRLDKELNGKYFVWDTKSKDYPFDKTRNRHYFFGKVVFKFRCYKVEEIKYRTVFKENPFHFLKEKSGYGTDTLYADEFIKNTCLTNKELKQYLNTDKPNKHACAIHISDLEIFDEPKELREFKHSFCDNLKNIKVVKNFSDRDVFQFFDNERCSKCKHYDSDCNDCLRSFKPLTKAPQSFCYVEVWDYE